MLLPSDPKFLPDPVSQFTSPTKFQLFGVGLSKLKCLLNRIRWISYWSWAEMMMILSRGSGNSSWWLFPAASSCCSSSAASQPASPVSVIGIPGAPGPPALEPATTVLRAGAGETICCWTPNYIFHLLMPKGSCLHQRFVLFPDRSVRFEAYYWQNSCFQLCNHHDTRACNEQACPINCLLSEFSSWSDCSPCAKKQARNSPSAQNTHSHDGDLWKHPIYCPNLWSAGTKLSSQKYSLATWDSEEVVNINLI